MEDVFGGLQACSVFGHMRCSSCFTRIMNRTRKSTLEISIAVKSTEQSPYTPTKSHMLSLKIAELRHRTIQLHREIVLLSKYSSTEVHREDLQLGIPPSFMRFQARQQERS